MEKKMLCINCPMGCRLTVLIEAGKVVSVSGNNCGRGEDFARQEAIEPMRVLTCLMRIEGSERVLSVKTAAPIPKKLMRDCADYIFRHPLSPDRLPVHVGDVIFPDICGSGVALVASCDI